MKWWPQHSTLGDVIAWTIAILGIAGILFIGKRLPGWLTALGFTPSGVNLLLGTLSTVVGVWGLRNGKNTETILVLQSILCLFGGIGLLVRALGLV